MKSTTKHIKLRYHNNNEEFIFVEFESIRDITKYLEETPTNETFKHEYLASMKGDYYFTNTYSLEDAMSYLKNGWSEKTIELEKQFKLEKPKATTSMRKMVNSVQGYQPSVPRYLMGMPDSMIDIKKVNYPSKIITINKLISALSSVTTEQIFNSSIETLKIIKKLEDLGYRVKLNIIAGAKSTGLKDTSFISSVTIKQPNERLNLSKMTFPLIHPSMLRRITFRLREVYPNIDSGFVNSYGRSIPYGLQKEILSHFINNEKNTITLPSILPSNFKATDINSIDDFDKMDLSVSG